MKRGRGSLEEKLRNVYIVCIVRISKEEIPGFVRERGEKGDGEKANSDKDRHNKDRTLGD
jgi:hypothetical protein